MNETLRLWILARDADLRRRWTRWLRSAGWAVHDLPAEPASPASLRSADGPALLDAGLLDAEAIPDLRKKAHGPLVLFERREAATSDRVSRMLLAGADDFVTTDIQERVLVAKLLAHARRLWPDEAEAKPVLWSPKRIIRADRRRKIVWVKGKGGEWDPLRGLREMEFRLLCVFLLDPETPLERGALLDRLWGERAGDINPITLNKHIESLRRRLGPRGTAIQTLYGYGYMFLEGR